MKISRGKIISFFHFVPREVSVHKFFHANSYVCIVLCLSKLFPLYIHKHFTVVDGKFDKVIRYLLCNTGGIRSNSNTTFLTEIHTHHGKLNNRKNMQQGKEKIFTAAFCFRMVEQIVYHLPHRNQFKSKLKSPKISWNERMIADMWYKKINQTMYTMEEEYHVSSIISTGRNITWQSSFWIIL